MHRRHRSVARRPAAALAVITAVAAGLLIASPASPASADDPAAPSAAKADDYIVVLKDDADTPATSVQARARKVTEHTGTRPGYIYRHALRGFTVRATPDQAKDIAADPAVAYVEKDRAIPLIDDLDPPAPTPDRQATPAPERRFTPSWGLDRIDQRHLPLDLIYNYTTTADNVHAYVLDTGIRFDLADFGGRATSGPDFVDNDDDSTDCGTHGTRVADILGGSAYGVAKGVRLVGVRVLRCGDESKASSMIAGIDWVTANAIKPAVANMSFGKYDTIRALATAVTNSIASGITYVAAAGNDDGDACDVTPARVPEVITVGATTDTDERADYSNWGPCLDIFAPGTYVVTANPFDPFFFAFMSGTSAAAPHVAGAAALYLAENPTATPAQVHKAIVEAGTKGVVTGAGANSPNVLLYTGP